MNAQELTGRADSHVCRVEEPECVIHRDVVQPIKAMRAAAEEAGIDLVSCSAFRDFAGQLTIWNSKYKGERPLYKNDGSEFDHASLGEEELIDSILKWSALPGASRHHWGTEIDVIDRAAIPDGYKLRLMPDEYADGGVFESLGKWLDGNTHAFGFFRPYEKYLGGVSAEPWHLSYAPVSVPALDALKKSYIVDAIEENDLFGKQAVLDRLDRILDQYVLNICPPN
jgi:LAS superfamily LD-carboxypeptidase LdcB